MPCIINNKRVTSDTTDHYLPLTFRSLPEIFTRRSLFNSSSGSSHGRVVAWQQISRGVAECVAALVAIHRWLTLFPNVYCRVLCFIVIHFIKYFIAHVIIQLLKLYAWESFFVSKILGIRDQELKVLRKGAVMSALTYIMYSSSSLIVSYSSLV